MITKVRFQNLRCFKDFTLEHITPVTLLSGRNNAGKTALLEGVLLLCEHRSPELFFKINTIRGMSAFTPSPQGFAVGLEPFSLWETLFHNMDMTQQVCIAAENEVKIESSICLKKYDDEGLFSLIQAVAPNAAPDALQPVPGTYVLQVAYTYGDEKETARFALTQNGLGLKFDAPPRLPIPLFTTYLGPNTPLWLPSLPDWFSKVDLENRKSEIVDAMRLLDDGITDIFPVTKLGVTDIYARWSTAKPRPVRTLGDGINKLLRYLLAMIANPGGIFLLDEIETGFHYSFYPKLWEMLASVALSTKSQIIATTHSYECIQAYVDGVSEVDASLLHYVRMGREKDGIRPYSFIGENIAYAMERNMEVR
jgi:ABC-type branched-subunit amino acid transport system ATPase component